MHHLNIYPIVSCILRNLNQNVTIRKIVWLRQKQLTPCTSCSRQIATLTGEKDRYNGIHLSLEQLPHGCSAQRFEQLLSGCVIHEQTDEVLVVRDRNRPYTLWKFPGGLAELAEDIGKTAEREVLEETGVKTEFRGILAFRQQHNHPGAFGRSDMFFLCRMKPHSYDLHPCTHEIEACQWITLEELSRSSETSAFIQRVIQLLRLGMTEGFDKVELTGQEVKSVYKRLVFKLFTRSLPKADTNVGPYQHSLGDVHEND